MPCTINSSPARAPHACRQAMGWYGRGEVKNECEGMVSGGLAERRYSKGGRERLRAGPEIMDRGGKGQTRANPGRDRSPELRARLINRRKSVGRSRTVGLMVPVCRL